MINLHVSPAGSDDHDGSAAAPFATLPRARDELRRRGHPRPATVWLAAGDYELDATFELTAADSGAAERPVVYRAVQPHAARLLGGRRVRGWVPVRDPAVLDRLTPEARGHVMQADLRMQGITDFGQLRSRGFGRGVVPAGLELFFAGRPMTLARWPNEGHLVITGVPPETGQPDGHGGTLGALDAGFFFSDERPRRWRDLADAWVHGYWAWDWANSYERIASLDPAAGLIRTASPHGLYGFRPGQRIYFLNVLEELDTPGEWFLDRGSGLLYFWPPEPPESLAESEAVVSVLETPLIALRGASHVRFEGLTLEACRGHAMEIAGGGDNLVAGCAIRHVGNYAVWIDGGAGHAVRGCDISYTGDGGVFARGGDRTTLTTGRNPSSPDRRGRFSGHNPELGDAGSPANDPDFTSSRGHLLHNNHFHHLARWSRCYMPAVRLEGVGHRVAHNLIHDHPHTAILFNGNDHLIEFNEIYSACTDTGDVGAIYLGRDWTERGHVVRHNFIHHLGGVGMGSMAMYMDDCASGVRLEGNVFYRTQRAAFIGGGRDNRVEGNVFVDCHPAVHLDARGLDPAPVWRDMVRITLRERLEAMRPHEPPYATRYPELATLDPLLAAGEGVPPGGNVVAGNLSVGGEWLELQWRATPAHVEVRDNLVSPDPDWPGFVEPRALDFRLRSDSPALAAGFRPPLLERIGLVRDEHRPRLVRVVAWLEPRRSDADGGAFPRLTLRNTGDAPWKGLVRLTASPAGGSAVADETRVVLAPQEEATVEFPSLSLAPGMVVESASDDPGLRPARLGVEP